MKNRILLALHSLPRFLSSLGAYAAALALWLSFVPILSAIPITGANGTTVEFAGVKAATPAGLEVKILASSNLAVVPWDKFDIVRLEKEQPDLFHAYQKTQGGETVELYLGLFEKDKPKPDMTTKAIPKSQQGYVQMEVTGKSGSGFSKMTIAMRTPSPNAKAIFLGAFGQGDGGGEYFSSIYLARSERTSWDSFLINNKLVPVGLRVLMTGDDPRKEPFFLADKGGGEAVFSAISQLARKAGRDDLAEAPIVIFGRETTGSAFAYNMAQLKPERVACAVAMKGGAFFTIEPTEASVKVPLLIFKGEYDDTFREWELEPTFTSGERIDPPHEGFNRYVSTLPMRPNWTMLIEPRGTADFGPLSEMVGQKFIEAVIKQRFGGGTYADMVPDIAYMGDRDSKSVKNMPEDAGVLQSNETWLPDQIFATVWRKLLEGTLTPGP